MMSTRSTFAWSVGPIVFVLSMTVIALITRWIDVPSPLIELIAPHVSLLVAWSVWALTLKPKYGFAMHALIGFVAAGLSLAVRVAVHPVP